MSETWRKVLPDWKSGVMFGFGIVAGIRVVIWPHQDYPPIMWALILYCLGFPVARIIDNVKNTFGGGSE